MNKTLRKLYHRRGKLLSYLNEIDRQINELTPQKGDLVVYDDGIDFLEGIITFVREYYVITNCGYTHLAMSKQYLTILEKGFER